MHLLTNSLTWDGCDFPKMICTHTKQWTLWNLSNSYLFGCAIYWLNIFKIQGSFKCTIYYNWHPTQCTILNGSVTLDLKRKKIWMNCTRLQYSIKLPLFDVPLVLKFSKRNSWNMEVGKIFGRKSILSFIDTQWLLIVRLSFMLRHGNWICFSCSLFIYFYCE